MSQKVSTADMNKALFIFSNKSHFFESDNCKISGYESIGLT